MLILYKKVRGQSEAALQAGIAMYVGVTKNFAIKKLLYQKCF